jgi:hypothetical protein
MDITLVVFGLDGYDFGDLPGFIPNEVWPITIRYLVERWRLICLFRMVR